MAISKKNDKYFGDLFRPVFSDVVRDTLAKIQDGNTREEDHITSTLFTLAEERVNKLSAGDLVAGRGLKITARQFPGRGRNSDESFIGADGAVCLRVKLNDLEIQKFYLFQAKRSTQKQFDERAAKQRDLMLHCTPDSFFLIYSPKGINVLSAFLVEQRDKFSELPTKSFVKFNEDFFNCFIGDHFLGFPDFSYGRPWRKWPYNYPTAKNNLLIEVSEKE